MKFLVALLVCSLLEAVLGSLEPAVSENDITHLKEGSYRGPKTFPLFFSMSRPLFSSRFSRNTELSSLKDDVSELQKSVALLSTKVFSLENALGGLDSGELTDLRDDVDAIGEALEALSIDYDAFVDEQEEKLDDLETDIMDSIYTTLETPSCPSEIPDGAVVDGQCYTLEVIDEKTFGDARIDCILKGGKLAEPDLTNTLFYSSLKAALPDEFNSLEISSPYEFYVGISTNDDGDKIEYTTTRAELDTAASVWSIAPSPTTGTTDYVGIVEGSAVGAWELTYLDPGTTTRPFLCQYNVISILRP